LRVLVTNFTGLTEVVLLPITFQLSRFWF